jgi:hypothetical protein
MAQVMLKKIAASRTFWLLEVFNEKAAWAGSYL